MLLAVANLLFCSSTGGGSAKEGHVSPLQELGTTTLDVDLNAPLASSRHLQHLERGDMNVSRAAQAVMDFARSGIQNSLTNSSAVLIG